MNERMSRGETPPEESLIGFEQRLNALFGNVAPVLNQGYEIPEVVDPEDPVEVERIMNSESVLRARAYRGQLDAQLRQTLEAVQQLPPHVIRVTGEGVRGAVIDDPRINIIGNTEELRGVDLDQSVRVISTETNGGFPPTMEGHLVGYKVYPRREGDTLYLGAVLVFSNKSQPPSFGEQDPDSGIPLVQVTVEQRFVVDLGGGGDA